MTSAGAAGPLPETVRGVVFDLDGTLIDSYEAITRSANAARRHAGAAAMTEAEIRGRVGHGLEALIAALVPAEQIDEGVRIFREEYASAYREGTRALPGAREALVFCNEHGLPAWVASNGLSRSE